MGDCKERDAATLFVEGKFRAGITEETPLGDRSPPSLRDSPIHRGRDVCRVDTRCSWAAAGDRRATAISCRSAANADKNSCEQAYVLSDYNLKPAKTRMPGVSHELITPCRGIGIRDPTQRRHRILEAIDRGGLFDIDRSG
jgi:hypothetical protein